MNETLRKSAICALALGLAACSDEDSDIETIAQYNYAQAENLGSCSAAWVPLTGGNGNDSEPPVDLLYAEENLYFFRFSYSDDQATSSELVRFALNARSNELATNVLVPDTYSSPLWVDGSELVYTQSNEVRSLPLMGGEVRTRSWYEVPGEGDVQWLGIVDGMFYFSRYGKQGAIWRSSLEGGEAELFAELGEDWGYRIDPPLVRAPEGLLLNGRRQIDNLRDRPVTVLLEPDGSLRDLPYPEGATASPQLTPTGVIHTLDVSEDSDTLTYLERGSNGDWDEQERPTGFEMYLSPLDGSDAIEFWADKPAAVKPDHVEWDGREGWFVSATENFDDGFRHDTLWHVRPEGDAVRLACNPRPENSRVHTDSRVGTSFATGNGSVYLVSSTRDRRFWELVEISLGLPN